MPHVPECVRHCCVDSTLYSHVGTGDFHPTAHALTIVMSYPWLCSGHEQELPSTRLGAIL